MLIPLHGLKSPKHKNCYVLFIRGYFGDGDEFFTEELSSGSYVLNAKSQSEEDKEEYIERAYRAYEWFDNNHPEERRDLPDEHKEYIHGASWDFEVLPTSIEEISLLYYDNLGYPNDVEIM